MEVNVTNHLERCGIEVKIDSMQNDGSQSWIEISRGINKDAIELSEENRKPFHYEGVSLGAGQPVVTKQQEQITPSSSASSTTVMPFDQRKWKDTPAVVYFGGILIQCLEVNDPNTTAWRCSWRNKWSNGMEQIVT